MDGEQPGAELYAAYMGKREPRLRVAQSSVRYLAGAVKRKRRLSRQGTLPGADLPPGEVAVLIRDYARGLDDAHAEDFLYNIADRQWDLLMHAEAHTRALRTIQTAAVIWIAFLVLALLVGACAALGLIDLVL